MFTHVRDCCRWMSRVARHWELPKMLSIMLSQFNVCIDDLNPARREVNRIMWYCVCSQISTADGQFGKPARLRRNRLILTPKSGLVVGIRDLCSVYARFGPIRQRSASAFGQLPYCEHNVHTCRWMSWVARHWELPKMLSIMLSQFNICIDDLNPARREVIRIMWYGVCEHTVNIYQPMDNSENPQDYAAIGWYLHQRVA